MDVLQEPSQANIAIVVEEALAKHAQSKGNLLPVLHDVQDAFGFIPSSAIGLIANGINISRAEVHGVVTYYSHFYEHPPARCSVKICRAESCIAMGANHLMQLATEQLGCQPHGQSADQSFSLEPVYCLGFCANSPAIMIDDEAHARVTPTLFLKLLDQARSDQQSALSEISK
jgi:formate dehydrogenase subunit gamma